MNKLISGKRRIAVLLLLIWSFSIFGPEAVFALTSGPSQPEAQKFQPAGVTDMVDTQNGGLKYNIPLIDIDGYPINLNYQSGSGIDDEASWVGLGWSLNPGAINRQVRGIPDDFNADTIETDHYMKPKVTVGGRLTAKVEYGGYAKASGSFTFGVFSDNYTGIGAEVGVNAGISFSTSNDGGLTAGLGAGVLSNTQSGVDASVSPYVCMALKENGNEKIAVNAGLSASLGYNTRSGLKGFTLGASFGLQAKDVPKGATEAAGGSGSYSIFGSNITYNTQCFSPSIKIPFSTTYDSFSFDVGGEAWGVFLSGGGTGYQSVRSVAKQINIKPAYGYLYSEKGKNNPDAVMDFIREQDNPIVPGLTNIAIPINTPDMWNYTSQTGSGQFRLYRGGTGVFFDNQATDVSAVHSNGGDIGLGAWFHGGITHYQQETHNTTHKWTQNNAYLANGDFQDEVDTLPGNQQVYFRQVGEKNLEDAAMNAKIYTNQALQVGTSGINADNGFHSQGNLYGTELSEMQMSNTNHRHNRTMISYLTAAQASAGSGALDQMINTYAFNTVGQPLPTLNHPVVAQAYPRLDKNHKASHISEIRVTDDGGKRIVYGLPVYNYSQDEYTFAVGKVGTNYVVPATNQIAVPANPLRNNLGVDNYYLREHKTAYASSFLLTGILSPDYVDKTGDGISPDDIGTAIKFNYSRVPMFRWRTPYQNATLNKALLADADDDKGSIIYGTKELYYISSIETKTKIAYFITQDRKDALGVSGWQNALPDSSIRQKRLMQIRLYSKGDMTRPIKVVNFGYDYELCKGIPNSTTLNSATDTLGGKLTLKKIWFTYGNSTKGQYHPYTFTYNRAAGAANVNYGYMVTDRWGTYKQPSENTNALDNESYPYSNQNKATLDANSALWHLNTIGLPTGGMITITFESNDYAYVQNQRAMVMTPIESLIGTAASADTTSLALKRAHGIRINIGASPPAGTDPTAWFENNYLDGSDYMYTKLYVKLSTGNTNSYGADYDYVPCYAHVSFVSFTGNIANVMLTDNSSITLQHRLPLYIQSVTMSPLTIAAWQRLKNEYPKYAYPGYDNKVNSANSSVLGAVSAIVNAARNLSELKKNFYQTSFEKGYAATVDLTRSFVKLTKASGFKYGGGARVKKIQIADNWNLMSGGTLKSQYGQAYSYTTIDNGKVISSGVATYEPAVGNDENALKQPVPYIEKIQGSINNFFDLEKPFCESLYPSPEVGYSKVTSQDIDQNGNVITSTGSIVNEYYTARDFPVAVTALPLSSYEYKPSSTYSLMKTNSTDDMTQSQGYSIQLNDMHGKLKATRVLNQSGAEISSSVYTYGATDNGGVMSLNNAVTTIGNDGSVLTNQNLGREIEFFTDFREQQTINQGKAINIGVDVVPSPFIFFPFLPLPHFPVNGNNDYKMYRSACAVKVIQQYGILTKVVKSQNGSSISTENLAYDPTTGEPVVTRTQNEFKQYIYSVNIPAYWTYPGMGPAYQNLGTLFQNMQTNTKGEVKSTVYQSFLHEGDELIDCNTTNHYWVINTPGYAGVTHSLKLITRSGQIAPSITIGLSKILQSGYKNMLNEKATTIVCLNNPINSVTGKLSLSLNTNQTALKIVNASVTTYNQNWATGLDCSLKKLAPKPLVTYTDHTYAIQLSPDDTTRAYCDSGAVIQQTLGGSTITQKIPVWTSALNRTGIWVGNSRYDGQLNNPDNYRDSTYLGFQTCLSVPTTQTYYFGFGGDNGIKVYLDNSRVALDSTTAYRHWTIRPHILTAGSHQLKVTFINNGGPAIAGLEIYNNPYTTLSSSSLAVGQLSLLFSSSSLVGSTAETFIPNYESSIDYRYRYADGTIPDACNVAMGPVSATLNPFIYGFLGNWRNYQSYVYQQNRVYKNIFGAGQNGIDVKNAGYINVFYTYWYYNPALPGWAFNPNGGKYVAANTVTQYDQYGQQTENMDALGRYSAAKFDFNGELPSAVVSNSTKREIFAESFEDARFTPGTVSANDSCSTRNFFSPTSHNDLRTMIIDTISHSGNYCALLPTEGVTMSTLMYGRNQRIDSLLLLDSVMEYQTNVALGIYPHGFEPSPNKKYIFDAWVKDGHPNDNSVNLKLTVNGKNVPLKCRAVVENWKLLEGIMPIAESNTGTSLNVSIVPVSGSTVFIDDIRMHPYDAQMKSYAYDDKTMRLMAELDENGFATFYEYDDEGLLIRVKKETEKGVMTIKETRSSYKQSM